jgi:flagellar hook-associated protein 3 FlgL
MRITPQHIIELAAAATSRAQSAVADATSVASSGLRVAKASDDPAAWAAAQRDRVRQTLADGDGSAIATGRGTLEQTDGSLSTIAGIVAQARTLATQAASATYNASDRAALGTQVQGLFQAALAAANAQSGDGEYLLAGAKSTTPPFDANGNYQGDATARTVSASPQAIGVPGSMLTAANGVDVLPELAKLATALSSNNVAGIQASLGTLTTATDQVSLARGRAGTGLAALSQADDARQQLSTHLDGVISDLVEADTVGAASSLARATQALDVSRAISTHVIASLTSSSG